MTKNQLTRAARYMGIAAGLLVPALVVAQSLPSPQSLQAGQLLRANDVLLLREGLDNALSRITALESAAVTKSRVYNNVADSAPIASGATATATASCDGASDLAIACSCGGTQGGSGVSSMNTRSFLLRNGAAAVSTCACNGEWLGTGTATVTSQVTCLTGP